MTIASQGVHGDPSVLGLALLGDVHRRHDLDARDDRPLEMLRVGGDLFAATVDPVADPHSFRKRFDVDVTGPGPDGILDDLRDEPDNRRIVGPGLFRRLGEGLLIRLLRVILDFVVARERVPESRRRADRRLDLFVDEEAKRVQLHHLQWIVHGHEELTPLGLDGYDAEFRRHLGTDQPDHVGGDHTPSEVHEREPVLAAQPPGQPGLVEIPELDERLAEAPPVRQLVFERFIPLVRVDPAFFDQDFPDLLAIRLQTSAAGFARHRRCVRHIRPDRLGMPLTA